MTDTLSSDAIPASGPLLSGVGARKDFWQRAVSFGKAVWFDHDLWVRGLAVKGGAAAVVLSVAIAVTYVAALPMILAVLGVTACCGVVGIGLYGMFAGMTSTWDRLRDIYSRTIVGKTMHSMTPVTMQWGRELLAHPRVQALLNKPLVQKLINSRAGKKIKGLFAQRAKDVFLSGLALNGALFWGAVAATIFVTNIVAVPILALGSLSLVTIGILASAADGIVGNIVGACVGTQSLIRNIWSKKQDIPVTVKTESAVRGDSPVAQLPSGTLTKAFSGTEESSAKAAPEKIAPPSAPPPS